MGNRSIYAERKCAICEKIFTPHNAAQKYCKYTCRAEAIYHKNKKISEFLWKAKKCEICGTDFSASSPSAKYCKKHCRELATQRKRDKRNGVDERAQLFRETSTHCDFCSKKYLPRNTKQRYCNESCKIAFHAAKSRQAQLDKKRIPCAICRKPFSPKSILNVYCSSECLSTAKIRRLLKNRTVICSHCSKVFTTYGAHKDRKMYCSVQCKELARKTRLCKQEDDKVRKRDELFAKGVRTMILPICQGAESSAHVPFDLQITEKNELDSPTEYKEEIAKFLAKGGIIQKLQLNAPTEKTSIVMRELSKLGIDAECATDIFGLGNQSDA